jgi:hypothetical protein
VLAETGIRRLRDQPVFTTPRLFAPADFEQQDVTDGADFREAPEPQNCYVCKQDYRRCTTSTTSSAPPAPS